MRRACTRHQRQDRRRYQLVLTELENAETPETGQEAHPTTYHLILTPRFRKLEAPRLLSQDGRQPEPSVFPAGPRRVPVSSPENPRRWEADGDLFAAAFEHAPVMMAISVQGEDVFLEVNREFERVSGYSREEVVGKSVVGLGLIAPEERERLAEVLGEGGPALGIEMLFRAKNGASRRCLCSMVPVSIGGVARTLALGIDVTGHARYEVERGLTIELLGLLNAPSTMREMMEGATRLLQEFTGCAAVAIRVREGSDFPFYTTFGLSNEFVREESCLCAGADSELECLCGAVLTGEFKP